MKKKFLKLHKYISALLIGLILSGVILAESVGAAGFEDYAVEKVFLTVSAAEVGDTDNREVTIKIKNVEDLLEFAENCALDSWSKDKTVILQADIYLEDIEFLPIPTFGGTFDGKGHSIVGLDVTDSVSPAGLFGVLQEGAVVKNLNVSGNITPSGENSAVGGIAGENYGAVISCTFTGTVSGTQNVGGIVGMNGYTGQVQSCRMSGLVLGESMTGGIAGCNQGMISKSKNNADVNNVSVDTTISMDEINLDISMDVTEWNSMNLMSVASDSGGVAGYSVGIIYGSSNAGTIGYPHVGYNLGGIAGRSSGYISECFNDGEIYGRKDVGGIVGQMEPYVEVELSESGVAQIQGELAALDRMLSSAEANINNSSAAMQRRVQKIQSYMEDIQESLAEAAAEQESDRDEEDTEDDSDTTETSVEEALTGALSELTQNRLVTELKVDMDLLLRQLELLTYEAANSAGTLGEDITNIGNQTVVLSDTFKGVMQELENLSLSDFVADISVLDLETATYGKIVNCQNNEAVYADMNVGGIAGITSMEYELDPEDDLTTELSMQERRQYELTAIVYKSANYGTVTAKKDYVGGICGYMNLGFVADCESYGYVASESGDYVGGIAGLTGSTIQNCFAKCSLAGANYIGGIVGAGIVEDATGESSLVSRCYSMVDIIGYQQFAGAVAGVNAGEYLECYFVSEDLQGINRISYAEQAEPISYEELLDVSGLPEEFESFTLSFVANGNAIYATTFEYGDSFDEDIFPEVPAANGSYGQWDVQELKNLQKDTVVTAVYTPYVSALASEELREDGRPLFLAEGHFGESDRILAEAKEISFNIGAEQSLWDKLNAVEVLEQWRVEIPEDGLLIHTLRYLTAETEADTLDVYVKQDGKWELSESDWAGSYLMFAIAGSEAEVAVVATTNMWGLWIAAAVAVCMIIGGIIWMILKKKNILKWFTWILAVMLLICVILVIVVLLNNKLMGGVKAYRLLEDYLAQPEQAMTLEIEAEVGDEQYDMKATVFCTELEGQKVTCIQSDDVQIFYADGILYLENGNAYQTSEVSGDYGSMLEQVAALYEVLDIETTKTDSARAYTITVQEQYAQSILEYLLPYIAEEALETQTLQAELREREDVLTEIILTSQGKLQNSEKSKYSLNATMTVINGEKVTVEIPDLVKEAILAEDTEIEAVITTDIFRLYRAWKNLNEQNPMGAQIYLHADCGPLTLDEDVTFISALADGVRINCIQKNDFSVYFNEDTICSEKGYSVTTQKAAAVEAADLLGIAYNLCLSGNFSCIEVDGAYIYSVVLDEEGMKEIAATIAPESADLAVQFENGSVQLITKDNQLDSIRFACDGELDVLLTKVAVALSAELEIEEAEKYQSFTIPEKVLEKLAK